MQLEQFSNIFPVSALHSKHLCPSPMPIAALQVEEGKPVPDTADFLLGCVLCKLQQSSLLSHPCWVWVFIKPLYLHRTPRKLTFSKRAQNMFTEYNDGYLLFPTVPKYFLISDGTVNGTNLRIRDQAPNVSVQVPSKGGRTFQALIPLT